MGLDTTHDCWHGSYLTFNIWRNKLAEVAGYKITDDGSTPTPDIDWGKITISNLRGFWDRAPEDPLLILIAHYDCDGIIKAEYTKPIADRLTQLLPMLPNDGRSEHICSWQSRTQRFIDGLLSAHEANEDVEFC